MLPLGLSLILILLLSTPHLDADDLQANSIESPIQLRTNDSSPPTQGKEQSTAITNTNNTQGHPPQVTQPVSPSDHQAKDSKERFQHNPNQSDGNIEWNGWVQAFVSAFGLVIIWLTLREVRAQASAAKDAAIAGRDSAHAALEEAKAIKLAERAYINVSPFPPGLSFGENATHGSYLVELKITNVGRTPATITDTTIITRCLPKNEKLPIELDYTQAIRTPGTVFLAPTDFVQTGEQATFKGLNSDSPIKIAESVKNGEVRFVILGYVDYIDTFGQRHRYGYAREYDYKRDIVGNRSPEKFRERNNFVFVPETNYNYDCEYTNQL